jgi:hypothetical protein
LADARVKSQKEKVEFLMWWEGYEQEDPTLQLWEHFRNSTKKALSLFHKPYSGKPQDGRVIGLVKAYFRLIIFTFGFYT